MDVQDRILGISLILSFLLLIIASTIRGWVHHKRTEPEGDGLLNDFFGRVFHPKNQSFRIYFPIFLKIENEPLLTPNDIRIWNTWTKVTYATISFMAIVTFLVTII